MGEPKNKPQAPTCSEIATEIATAILTVYGPSDQGTECTRVQMMLKGADGTEVNMGGRSKSSIVNQIDEVLKSHGFST